MEEETVKSESKPYADGQLIMVSQTIYRIVDVYKGDNQLGVVAIENVTYPDRTIDGIDQNVMYVPIDILWFALRDRSVKRYEEIKE
jgi:hypothetical protein